MPKLKQVTIEFGRMLDGSRRIHVGCECPLDERQTGKDFWIADVQGDRITLPVCPDCGKRTAEVEP